MASTADWRSDRTGLCLGRRRSDAAVLGVLAVEVSFVVDICGFVSVFAWKTDLP